MLTVLRSLRPWLLVGLVAPATLVAQAPPVAPAPLAELDPALIQAKANADATALAGTTEVGRGVEARAQLEDDRIATQIEALKAREGGPRRFAADLFDIRQRGTAQTEGGIGEDYVLGTGDRLQVHVFGATTFEVSAQVDGAGKLVIPRLGTVAVAGKTLGQARQVVQGLVNRTFSRATVELQVGKLREVRVFVMGEVYKSGSFLVPSLSSVVNVLGLSGGPSALGSYRDIRVQRGGRTVFRLDLYPLRAEGQGNVNFSFQSGDVVFVPLAAQRVLLRGGFERVVAARAQESALEAAAGGGLQLSDQERLRQRGLVPDSEAKEDEDPEDPGKEAGRVRGDHRLKEPSKKGKHEPLTWVEAFERTGVLPELQFELLPGERVQEVLRWAGGQVAEANGESLSLQRRGADGRLTTVDVRLGMHPEPGPELRKGDILSAYPLRDQQGSVVSVQGWVRAPGSFSRSEGLTVGKLLARDQQTLPNTYQEKGEIQRLLPDGSRQYLTFSVREALAGRKEHDLLLADRDVVELYKTEDLRVAQTVTVTGPVARPGEFPFLQGMRAADLVFRAGLTVKSANTQEAELARFVDGKVSQVIRLDLQKLASTDRFSPVDLKDDRLNPELRPDDQLNIFQKPGFRVHRSVMVFGQVARPGTYTLDEAKVTLSMILKRAGGATADAMVKAGILVRRNASPKSVGNTAIGVSSDDPSGLGVGDILERLNETKRDPREGRLLRTPVLHGIAAGKMNRLVVNFGEALKGDPKFDVELEDGDAVIIPRTTDAAYVVGETASPFGRYKVNPGLKVKDLLQLAGGTTRNADTWNIRLLKADGRIVDSWVSGREVEPGDTLLVPQRIRRDTTWQENLNALTPLALILNAIK